MKHLKKFKQILESKKIAYICQKYSIENYTINEDGSIDVIGDVKLNNRELTKLPLKFRNITGGFDCFNNRLVNLEGAPQSVGGYFDCSDNQLTTLEGAPQSVGGYFNCSYNQLTTLEGSPQSVGGDFACRDNNLSTLEGAPQSIGGSFYCYNNQLVSLDGASSCRDIYCSDNPIYRWWKIVNDINKLDVFIDLCIDVRDPDFMNQEKIDLLKE